MRQYWYGGWLLVLVFAGDALFLSLLGFGAGLGWARVLTNKRKSVPICWLHFLPPRSQGDMWDGFSWLRGSVYRQNAREGPRKGALRFLHRDNSRSDGWVAAQGQKKIRPKTVF